MEGAWAVLLIGAGVPVRGPIKYVPANNRTAPMNLNTPAFSSF